MVRKSKQYKGGYDDNSDGILNTTSTAKQGLTHHIGKLVSAAHGAVKGFLFDNKEDEEKSRPQLGGKRKRKTKGRKSHKKKTRKHTKSKRHSRRRRR
jgi:hypothetical protein